jgi:hypothetical protein
MMTYRFDSEPVQDITGGWYRACDVDRLLHELERDINEFQWKEIRAATLEKSLRMQIICMGHDLHTEQEGNAAIYRRVEEKNASAEIRRLALQRILDIVQETP